MENTNPISTSQTVRVASSATWAKDLPGWLRPFAAILTVSRVKPLAYSLADQALAVGGGFLANVALARTQTKEAYGMFALSYSVYLFLSSLHNAAILEPYTVYGSGRYRERF